MKRWGGENTKERHALMSFQPFALEVLQRPTINTSINTNTQIQIQWKSVLWCHPNTQHLNKVSNTNKDTKGGHAFKWKIHIEYKYTKTWLTSVFSSYCCSKMCYGVSLCFDVILFDCLGPSSVSPSHTHQMCGRVRSSFIWSDAWGRG